MLHIFNPQILQIFNFLKFSLGYFYSCITRPPTWVALSQKIYDFGLFKTYEVATHIQGMYGTTNMQNEQIHSHYSYKFVKGCLPNSAFYKLKIIVQGSFQSSEHNCL
jgi:hypothetical protein